MSKKILILISVVIVIIVAFFGVWYFTNKNGEDKTINDFFSFGLPDFDTNGNGFLGIGGGDGLKPGDFEEEKKILRQLSQTPTSGITTTSRTITIDGVEEIVGAARMVERSTGHVHDVVLDTGDRIRVSNTTIPKVYEVLWKDDASGFIARFLDDTNSIIKTFSADILTGEEGVEEGKLDGVFLEEDIDQIAISSDNDLFYLKESNNTGVRSDFDGDNKKQVIDMDFSEWLYQWTGSSKVLLTTKPSSSVPGYTYSLNTTNGSLEKILGGINGLTTLANKSGEKILYSFSTPSGALLSTYDIQSKESALLSLITLPEKCVWGSDDKTIYCGVPTSAPTGEYPDDWYKGIMSFSDDIWKLDLEFGIAELLVSPTELLGVEMDIIKLALTENEESLVFINKKDLTAWTLDL